jgi:hypothetical protein
MSLLNTYRVDCKYLLVSRKSIYHMYLKGDSVLFELLKESLNSSR